ncbi:GtrA family protein [Paenibacillus campi]|uniref:GtrA family protein n=1 Tax=Paenibacillus campi TaxID=3106031 RepID=UPI002B001719|nr:GtrA family protein [Paenibacillus sp. SGZ-1014]
MLKKQLLRFFVTGCSAVITDSIIYYLLLHVWPASVSKGVSFLCGAGVAFILNKLWTFEAASNTVTHIWKFSILYASTLAANIAVNKLVLIIFNGNYILAFLMATGTSMVLNFVGQKWWVFKSDETVSGRSVL